MLCVRKIGLVFSLAVAMLTVFVVSDDTPVVIGDGATVIVGDPVPPKNCSVPTDKSCPDSQKRECAATDVGYDVTWEPELDEDGDRTGLWYPVITYGTCDAVVEDIDRDSATVKTCENSFSKTEGTSIPEDQVEKVCFVTRPCLSEPQKMGGPPRATIKWRSGGPNGQEVDGKTTKVYYYVCQPVIAGPTVNLPNDDRKTVKWQPCKAYTNCLREFKVNQDAVVE